VEGPYGGSPWISILLFSVGMAFRMKIQHTAPWRIRRNVLVCRELNVIDKHGVPRRLFCEFMLRV
jgi:hypothetical protein